jgi:arylsulfatase A
MRTPSWSGLSAFQTWLLGWWLAATLASVAQTSAPVTSPRPRNIVLMLADDLGARDLGCDGADLHETPRIDQLAREGMRFTQAYAMSVCSPTRAALLTGRHAARLRLTTWREASLNREADAAKNPRLLLPPVTGFDLPTDVPNLAQVMRSTGRLTFQVGKWHLGDAAHAPERYGFDVQIGGTHWGAPATFFHPFRGPFGASGEFRYVPGLGLGQPGDYLTDRITDEAIRLMDQAGERPFFLSLCFHNPHTPIEGKPELVARYRDRLNPGLRHQNPEYAAMIRTLDDNVGRVLDALDRRNLRSQTLVIFTSDNGGYTNHFRGQRVTDNGPLRSGKGSLYEGGIRVPLIVRFPGLTMPSTECSEPVLCTDLFPTLAELAGAPTETQAASLDGMSLVPLLGGPGGRLQREALFFHFPHYYSTTTPVSAVRARDWKLLEYHEDHRVELYRLTDDPGETRDIAGSHPAEAKRLRRLLHDWYGVVDAQMPLPNPAMQR